MGLNTRLRSGFQAWLALAEGPRAAMQLGALVAGAPVLGALSPRPDVDQPVLVIPGFLADDDSTWILRTFLDGLGYSVYPWEMGTNLGVSAMGGYEPLVRKLTDIHRQHERKVALVGWSLGGVHALAVAHRAGYAVSQVVTLGSPLRPAQSADEDTLLYSGLKATAARLNPALDASRSTLERWRNALLSLPDDLPVTSIYSRTDAVVPWQRSRLDTQSCRENIEVVAGHIGLGVSPAVFFAVADRLAQPPGSFNHFEINGLRNFWYPPQKSSK